MRTVLDVTYDGNAVRYIESVYNVQYTISYIIYHGCNESLGAACQHMVRQILAIATLCLISAAAELTSSSGRCHILVLQSLATAMLWLGICPSSAALIGFSQVLNSGKPEFSTCQTLVWQGPNCVLAPTHPN